MKRPLLLSTGFFFLFLASASSQGKTNPLFIRNQIGIQFIPYLNEQLLSTGGLRMIDAVPALHYGYRITKNVTTGMEFVYNFPIKINSGQNFHFFNYFVLRLAYMPDIQFYPKDDFRYLLKHICTFHISTRNELQKTIILHIELINSDTIFHLV